AISMGYLDMDVLEVLRTMARCAPRDFNALDSILTSAGPMDRIPRAEALKPLAEFGLLLMAASGTALDVLRTNHVEMPQYRGVVYELNLQDKNMRSFGEEYLSLATSTAIAPASAAHYGFTPGNLFVTNRFCQYRGTNNGAVTEFTPEGQFVRA